MTKMHKLLQLSFALLLLSSLSLSGCGGGIDTGHGLRTEGVFVGTLSSGVTVTLILQGGHYFLDASALRSSGTYAVTEVTLSGTGNAYNVTTGSDYFGTVALGGTYRTNKHIALTWNVAETGESASVIVESSDLYYSGSSLDAVEGVWVNQQTDAQSSDIQLINITNGAIDGTVLSSLTHITGTIAVSDPESNVYSISLTMQSGGSTTESEPFEGFAIVTQADDGKGTLRPHMAITTSNSTQTYINNLFWYSNEELQNSQNSSGG